MSEIRIDKVGKGMVRIAVHGKLRGSGARELEEILVGLAEGGEGEALLDLSDCWSMDTLGVSAIKSAFDSGLSLRIVVGLSYNIEGELSMARLPDGATFTSVEDALPRSAGVRCGRESVGAAR